MNAGRKTTPQRRKRKLSIGEVFEIRLPNGQFGFARVIAKNDIGWLFEFFNALTSRPLSLEQILGSGRKYCAHVNEYSIRENWITIGHEEDKKCRLPAIFNGHPSFFWQIKENEMTRTVDAVSTSYDELIDKGYTGSTLWISQKLEEFLEAGEIPRFPLFTKFGSPPET